MGLLPKVTLSSTITAAALAAGVVFHRRQAPLNHSLSGGLSVDEKEYSTQRSLLLE